MLITVIIGILAMIGASTVDGTRGRAMVAAAKAELRQVTGAIERYSTIHGVFPAALEDLEEVGYAESQDVRVCRFEPGERQRDEEAYILVQTAHRSSEVGVQTRYPVWGTRMDEVTPAGDCKAKQPKKRKEPKRPGKRERAWDGNR